jgi:LysM repeat protein
MENKKSIGLPGGPNEFLKDITQYISVEGYKRYSKDINNPYNIIESSNITMEDVDFPVRGYGNNGVVQDMTPGAPHYDYGNADYVVEVPMAQDGREQATISQYVEPAWYEKALDYLASPMTAFGYLATGQDLPDRLPINAENRNAYDMVIDMVNPAAMVKYAAQAKRDYDNEEYLNAAFNTLGAIPIVPAVLSQGKNVVKGGKNVIKNAAKSTDEIFAGSDDIIKGTVRDTKPNARRLDAVTEVNPLSQNQAKNLAEQGRNKEIFDAFEEGANTIDDFIKSYSGDISSPEGFKRLVNQEADYLRSIGFDEARIASQAEVNAGARLNEIIGIGNTNRAIANGEKAVDAIVGNKYNFNNASYSPNTRNVEYLDDLFYQPGMDIGAFNLNKTKVGAKVLPGNTNLGTMFSNNRAVAAHEIGGHGLQSGRKLPIDSRLKKLEPLTDMNEATTEAYNYFMKGSKGKEPSAYLHELRQTMLDNNLIRNRYDHISSDQLKRFQTLFDLRPSGTVNTMADKFHSNTRILDFMKPTQRNFDLLARELNKLPAMAPIGIGLSGAAALSQERYGGSIPKAQGGNGEYKVASGDTFYGIANKNKIPWNALKEANPDLDYENLKLGQQLVLPNKIDRSPPMPKTGVSKNSNVLDYNALSNYLVDTRGGTVDTWGQLADTIAFHESSPWSRMDPKAKQYKGGPGRGLFQFEGESFDTALKRYKNIADAKGFTIKDSIVNAKSADQLSSEDQYTLFFANLLESKAKLSDYTSGNLSPVDVWLQGHKNVEAKGDRNSFLESKAAAEKEGIKNGYKTFQKGGNIENNIMYKNYINGVYTGSKMESKAEKIYDKLNRLHYRDAKAKQMTPANYVLTHVIG